MRTFSANTESEITKAITRPLYLIEIGFSTPLRLSSRGAVSYDGDSYDAARIELSLRSSRLRIFNAGLLYSAQFISEKTAGVTCKIWQLYGEAPFSAGDADLVFDGELGRAGVGEWVDVDLLEQPVIFAPRLYATAPTFNHIPPDGFEIATPYGVYKLERK